MEEDAQQSCMFDVICMESENPCIFGQSWTNYKKQYHHYHLLLILVLLIWLDLFALSHIKKQATTSWPLFVCMSVWRTDPSSWDWHHHHHYNRLIPSCQGCLYELSLTLEGSLILFLTLEGWLILFLSPLSYMSYTTSSWLVIGFSLLVCWTSDSWTFIQGWG